MTEQQHAEFVAPACDVIVEQALPRLRLPLASGKFMQRQQRIVTGSVGVMHGRPVIGMRAFADGQVFGDGNGLAVGDQKTEGRPDARGQVRTCVAAPGRCR